MSSKDKENSSAAAAASDRRPSATSVAGSNGSGGGGGGGQKGGGGLEAHQYVGPYRLEKTLGKGQTGKAAKEIFKEILSDIWGLLGISLGTFWGIHFPLGLI